MKILFIDPRGDVSGINAGIGYLAAALKSCGHEVKALDFNNNTEDEAERLAKALAWKPDIAAFSVKTNTVPEAARLAGIFKDAGAVTIAGGPGATCEKEGLLADNPVFDYAFSGEAENAIAAFASAAPGGDLSGLSGLCLRQGGKSVCNGTSLVSDLDSLKFPDYSDFDTVALLKEKYPLVTSRGCPYDCTYCSVNKISGRKWRFRSARNVIDELAAAKIKYGIKQFDIADDNFTMDMGRAKEICRLLIDEKIGLRWSCINGIRADRVDAELLALMKRSGCGEVWFGIESLNEQVFDGIKKGEKLESIVKAVRLAKDSGLEVCGFFVAGLPGSSYNSDMETLRKAKKLGLDEMLWSLATPYPHTEFYEWAKTNARQIGDFREVS